MTEIPSVDLGNGIAMPMVGFGTWQLQGQLAYEATRHALQVGYRHIDTATIYRNEEQVGRASPTAAWTGRTCSSPPSCRPATRVACGPPSPRA